MKTFFKIGKKGPKKQSDRVKMYTKRIREYGE